MSRSREGSPKVAWSLWRPRERRPPPREVIELLPRPISWIIWHRECTQMACGDLVLNQTFSVCRQLPRCIQTRQPYPVLAQVFTSRPPGRPRAFPRRNHQQTRYAPWVGPGVACVWLCVPTMIRCPSRARRGTVQPSRRVPHDSRLHDLTLIRPQSRPRPLVARRSRLYVSRWLQVGLEAFWLRSERV